MKHKRAGLTLFGGLAAAATVAQSILANLATAGNSSSAIGNEVVYQLSAALVGGVGGGLINICSSYFYDLIAGRKAQSPEAGIINHDLHSLIAHAIAECFELARTNVDSSLGTPLAKSDHAAVRQMEKGIGEFWLQEVLEQSEEFAAFDERQLIQLFLSSQENITEITCLSPEAWLDRLSSLSQQIDSAAKPSSASLKVLANVLHRQLAQMIRAKLKEDFRGESPTEGRAFAAFQLMSMEHLDRRMAELLQREEENARQSAELLQALKNLGDGVRKKRPAVVRALTPDARAGLSGMIERIELLEQGIHRRFDELNETLKLHDRKAAARHRAQESRARERHRTTGTGISRIQMIQLATLVVVAASSGGIYYKISSDARARDDGYLKEATREMMESLVRGEVQREFLDRLPAAVREHLQNLLNSNDPKLKLMASYVTGNVEAFADARKGLDSSLLGTAERVEIHIRAARVFRINGRNGDAVGELKQARKLDPSNREVLRELATVLTASLKLGDVADLTLAADICSAQLAAPDLTPLDRAEFSRSLALATAHSLRNPDRAALANARRLLRTAKELYAKEQKPLEEALVAADLGLLVFDSGTVPDPENLPTMIADLREAETLTAKVSLFPGPRRGQVLVALAHALADQRNGNRKDALREAGRAFRQAASFIDTPASPVASATARLNEALVLVELAELERDVVADAIAAARYASKEMEELTMYSEAATALRALARVAAILPDATRPTNLPTPSQILGKALGMLERVPDQRAAVAEVQLELGEAVAAQATDVDSWRTAQDHFAKAAGGFDGEPFREVDLGVALSRQASALLQCGRTNIQETRTHALELLRRATHIFKEHSVPENEAAARAGCGRLLLALGIECDKNFLKDAGSELEAAATLFEKLGDGASHRIQKALCRAQLYYHQSTSAAAAERSASSADFTALVSGIQSLPDSGTAAGEIHLWHSLYLLARRDGPGGTSAEDAAKHAGAAADEFTRAGNKTRSTAARAIQARALLQMDSPPYDEVGKHLADCVTNQKLLGPLELGRVLSDLALVKLRAAKPENGEPIRQATLLLNESQALLPKLQIPSEWALAEFRLGLCAWNSEVEPIAMRAQSASRRFEAAAPILEEWFRDGQAGLAWMNLAHVRTAAESARSGPPDYTSAVDAYRKARSLLQGSGRELDAAECNSSLGALLLRSLPAGASADRKAEATALVRGALTPALRERRPVLWATAAGELARSLLNPMPEGPALGSVLDEAIRLLDQAIEASAGEAGNAVAEVLKRSRDAARSMRSVNK